MPVIDTGKYRRAFEDMAPSDEFPEFKAKFPDASDEELRDMWNWLCRLETDDASEEPQPNSEVPTSPEAAEPISRESIEKNYKPSMHRTPTLPDWLESHGMSRFKFEKWLNDWADQRERNKQRAVILRDPTSIFDLTYRSKGKIKPVGQSLVESDYQAFAATCERLGLSVRGGLHIAMKAMVEAFPSPSAPLDPNGTWI
jgi:hypothetical protein